MKKFKLAFPKITYRNVNNIVALLWIAALILICLYVAWPLFALLGFVLLGIAFRLIEKYWRCPFCGIGLPWRESNIRYCPSCGKKLDL